MRSVWLTWPNNTWYSQVSPGAYGDGGQWDDSNVPQAHMDSSLSDASYDQISPPDTENWLLQHSYHGGQGVADSQVPGTYDPGPCGYTGLHQHRHQPQAHGRTFGEGSVNVQYSNTEVGCFDDPSLHMNHYTSISPDEGITHGGCHPGKHDAILWDWAQTTSDNVPLYPPFRTDTAVQDIGHTGRTSYFSKLSPTMATPRTQISPNSSCWDVDDNASLTTTNTTTPTDLIPDPPAVLLDPPPEDMIPSDKSMVPQRRNLKDPNHLYMPRWIRGDGKQREGWCGACRPGKWLSLKRSTYWCRRNHYL